MKRVVYIAFGIVCLLGLPFSVQAQHYTGVFEVYHQSIAYPETFDKYVANNQSLFGSQFSSCLNSLEQFWAKQAKQEGEICDGHVNPEFKAKCFRDAQFIPLVRWSTSLRSVLINQRMWKDTTDGQLTTSLKSMWCNVYGCDAYVNMINQVVQVVRPFFLCQTSTSANPEELSKDAWIDSASTVLPTAFCQSDQYFRQCFDVSKTECEETATSATRACLQKYKDQIPNILIPSKDGTYWGKIIGSCAGEAYEKTLLKKRISNKRCNDPNSWK